MKMKKNYNSEKKICEEIVRKNVKKFKIKNLPFFIWCPNYVNCKVIIHILQ